MTPECYRELSREMSAEAFDYVIVGAGSAGCVLADRLSADGRNTVLVLEYGGSDRSIFIQMPTALAIPMNMARYNWFYETEPEPHLGGRRLHTPRGKVLGGSSSINGLVYVRGNPLDFERWKEEGAAGWGYRDVLPYFRRAETRADGGDAYRGDSGPVQTRYGALTNPLHVAWVNAAEQAGYPVTADINGFQQEGVGRLDMTVGAGRRSSAANAYLRPAMKRANVSVRTHALATQIVFEGRRATGVAYRRGGETHVATARREVILAGGAINSPHLLKLSGVGPAEESRRLGIEPVHDLPGVGENLQDHLEFYFQVASKQPITLYSAMNPIAKALIGARWLLTHDGLGASNHFETGGFIRSRAGIRYPRYPVPLPTHGRELRRLLIGQGAWLPGPRRSDAVQEPRAGAARLAGSRRQTPDPVQLYEPSGRLDRDARLCAAHPRDLRPARRSRPSPGVSYNPARSVTTDEQIDDFIRAKVESAYHPCGACKMGREDDPMAVVDSQTRVIGLQGIRVVDSSIMPSVTTGNLNAPTLMIAEKAADQILGQAGVAGLERALLRGG